MGTLFIDGLPQGYYSHELRKLFSNHGYIADAYIPRTQRSRMNGRFGFIEVQAWEQGERLIHEVDGMEVGSSKIKVNWAKYPKRMRHSKRTGLSERGDELFRKSKNWRSKQQTTRVRVNEELLKQEKSAKVIKVEKVLDNLEWLGRSLTCISDVPRDIDSLRLLITQDFQEKIVVRDLGKFKFLLTMDSKETKDRLKIDGNERLKQWFSSFNDWNEVDVCQTRRLWLEIVGLPIQLWSEKNIKRIAEIWGDVVLVEKESSNLESFALAKVIIDTLCVSPIEDEVIIQVEDKGFKVSVFEAKTEYTIFHTGPLDGDCSGPTASLDNGKDSDGGMETQVLMDRGNTKVHVNIGVVQGGSDEDLARARSCDLNLNLNSNSSHYVDQHRVCHNKTIKAMSMVGVNQKEYEEDRNVGKLQGVVEKSPLITMNAEFEGATGLLEKSQSGKDAASCSSSTKTLTAQLSGNDYSMELEKINQLRLDRVQLNQVADLEDEVNQNEFCPVQPGSEVSAPPGFDIVEGSAPPGFEGSAAQNVTIYEKGMASREHTAPVVGKRMTRSQTKKTRTQVSRGQSTVVRTRAGKNNVKVSPIGRLSTDTTESMKQLAKDALSVGEMLGIKVISHRANAVKRITDSLKANRGTSGMRGHRLI